jgi:hypothetical protein
MPGLFKQMKNEELYSLNFDRSSFIVSLVYCAKFKGLSEFLRIQDSVVSIEGLAVGWTTGKLFFDPWQGQVIFLFYKMSRPAQGSNDPPNGYKGLSVWG